MALARYNGTIQDLTGNAVQSGMVTVIREGFGVEPLYSDREGLVSLANPITTGADGSFYFHVRGGAYRLESLGANGSKTIRYVAVGLGAESDFQGLNPRGLYSGAATYGLADMVMLGGYLFASRVDENIGNTPNATTPADTTEWMYLGPIAGTATSETILLTDFVGSNVTTVQPVFGTAQDSLALDSDTTYEFEAEYHIARSAGTTSHTVALLFGGTATFDSVGYLIQVTNPTGNVLANVQQIWAAAATAVTITAANTSATENLIIKLSGRLRTNVGGTFIPSFQYSAAPGGAPTIKANSCFRIKAIGNDQVTSIGAWS